VDGGADPSGCATRTALGIRAANRNHDPAVERFVESHRPLQLLNDELE